MRQSFARLPPGWWLSVALALGVVGWLYWRTTGWRELENDGRIRQWQRGTVLQIDDNRDGVVDEEITTDRKGRKSVRRDTDHDGWFDLKYDLGVHGITTNIQPIHERAPRH